MMRDGNLRNHLKKSASVAALGVFLLVASAAQSTQAMVVTDILGDASWITSLANQIKTMMQGAGQSAQNAMSTLFTGQMQQMAAQAGADAAHVEALNGATLPVMKDFTVPDKNGACTVALHGTSRDAARRGTEELSNSMGRAPNQTTAPNESKQMATQCKLGYLKKSEYPKLVQAMSGCVDDDQMADADLVVSDSDMLQMPTNASMSNGSVVFDDGSSSWGSDSTVIDTDTNMSAGTAQKMYRAGFEYCTNRFPDQPASAAGTPGANVSGTPSMAILATRAQRKVKSGALSSFKSCIKELNSRTAISNQLSGSFATLHAAQFSRCQSLNKMFIISDTDLSQCDKYGMSDARYNRLYDNRFSKPDYETNYLAAQKHLTPEQISILEQQADFNIRLSQMLGDAQKISNVQAINSAPQGGGPDINQALELQAQ